MTDFSHLDALNSRLFREMDRLKEAKAVREVAKGKRLIAQLDNDIAFREREIASCEREIEGEYKFLGIKPVSMDDIMNDDELLAELSA